MTMQAEIKFGPLTGDMLGFAALKVPEPNETYVVPCQEEVLRSDMTFQRSGPAEMVMVWDSIYENEATLLLEHAFPNETDASVAVNLWAPVRDAWGRRARGYALWEAELKRPHLGGDDGKPAADFETAYEDFTLHFVLVARAETDFTADVVSGALPLTVTFTDTSTGAPQTWSWTFGDGGVSSAQNPTHVYNVAGTYDVTLITGGDYGGGTKTYADLITVRAPAALVADFEVDYDEGDGPFDVNFTDLSTTDPDRPILTWDWDFGDGTPHGTTPNPAHTYAAAMYGYGAALYTVALTVTRAYAGTDTETKVDYISVYAPVTTYRDRALATEPASMIAAWPMNDNPGQTDIAEIVGGYDAVGTALTPYQTGIGDGSHSILFDTQYSTAHYVSPTAGADLDLTFDGDLMTLLVWVNAPQATWTDLALMGFNIVSLFEADVLASNLSICRDWSGADLALCERYSLGSIQGQSENLCAGGCLGGSWHCLAVTVDVASGHMRFFVDGAEAWDLTLYITAWDSGVGTFNLYEVLFGKANRDICGWFNTKKTPFLHGKMAHAYLWATVLSDPQIADLAVAI